MSTTITVTSAAELNQALSQATGGETILLAPGDYGSLSLKNTSYSSPVTLKSADPNAMASFSGLKLDQVSNVSFDTIKFDYTFSSGDATHISPFKISNSSNVSIDQSVFDGDFASGTGTTADGTGYGRGLIISGSTNIDVTNTEFHSWWKALSASKSSDINFSGNNIHTIRSDGISLGEVQNVLIENNYIHDFGGAAGSGDHRDMIQIQRSNGTGSSDIVIRNNVLDMGDGDLTQSIWAGSDKANYSDPTHWNYNILIEDNIIYNAQANGIGMHMADGLTIKNNTLIAVPSSPTGGVAVPKIGANGSKNVVIEQNVANAIIGDNGQSDWSVKNNVYIQNTDPSAPGYYDTQFVYHATAATDGYNQFGVISGSAVDQLNAGSNLVDNYPFDYNQWVGSSSSSGSNSVVVQPGTGSPAPSAPEASSPAPSAPEASPPAPSAPEASSPAPSAPEASSPAPSAPEASPPAPSAPEASSPAPSAPAPSGPAPTVSPPQIISGTLMVDIKDWLHSGAHSSNSATIPTFQLGGDRGVAGGARPEGPVHSEPSTVFVDYLRGSAVGDQQHSFGIQEHTGLPLHQGGWRSQANNNESWFSGSFSIRDLNVNDAETHFDFIGGRENSWGSERQDSRFINDQIGNSIADGDGLFVDGLGTIQEDFWGW